MPDTNRSRVRAGYSSIPVVSPGDVDANASYSRNPPISMRSIGVGCVVFATLALILMQNPAGTGLMLQSISSFSDDDDALSEFLEKDWVPQEVEERCDYVVNLFKSNNVDSTTEELTEAYAKQAVDANVFYRATAEIFWQDFARNNWDGGIFKAIEVDLLQKRDLKDKDTWTWVTGDQHLSNFGAFHNRHNNVVFSVNDFDEAAIYDFHVDVLRLAVSIYNHAMANDFSHHHVKTFMDTFTEQYISTVKGYVGNEEAIDFELTAKTAKGILKDFLKDVENDNSHEDQLAKYTDLNGSFIYTKKSRLEAINETVKENVRRAFTSQQYGATMMKTGWHVPDWDNSYFAVKDVARRLGSGVGSFGVDRYYVLLNGTDHKGIILDVKYEPEPAVRGVLSDDDNAWYEVLFPNYAARAVVGQRKLTSYVDPFTGWATIDGKAFVVRQKSPWKDSPNLDKITDADDFNGFIEMVAMATATSHTRGTQGKAPGEFKHVISEIFKKKSTRKTWGKAVFRIAEMYHEQVQLDYDCFKEYVDANYPSKKKGMKGK